MGRKRNRCLKRLTLYVDTSKCFADPWANCVRLRKKKMIVQFVLATIGWTTHLVGISARKTYEMLSSAEAETVANVRRKSRKQLNVLETPSDDPNSSALRKSTMMSLRQKSRSGCLR